MITYLLYNTILLGCFVSSYLAEKLDTKNGRLVCRFIVFLLLTVPASLRYYTGADYGNYLKMFYNIKSLESREILWEVLNKFTAFLGLPVQFIFIFSAILIYYPICFKLRRKHYCLAIVLYIVFMFYFKSYNGLRQMIAVSFVLWALIKFESKDYMKALLLYLISIGFHTSSILILPCFFISLIKIKGKKLPFFILLVIILFCLRFNCLTIMLSILGRIGSKYARFAKSSFYTGKTALGSGIGVFTRLLFSLLAVFFYKKIRIKYPEKLIALNLSIFFIISYLLAAQFVILGRLRDAFIFVPLIISGFAIESCGKYKKVVLILLLSINLFLFEKDIQKKTRDTFSDKIYPYYSIFYKGEIK